MLIPFGWPVNHAPALEGRGWVVGKSSGCVLHRVEDTAAGDVQHSKPVVGMWLEGKVAHVDHQKSWEADVEMRRWRQWKRWIQWLVWQRWKGQV